MCNSQINEIAVACPLHSNPDSRAWAKFFIETKNKNNWKIEDIDGGLMLGWFANAMMAMYDHLHQTKNVTDRNNYPPLESTPPAPTPAQREELANYAHDAWAGWMQYLFSKAELNHDGSWTMPKWAVERWQKQMDTAYIELSEEEKESDRVEADKILEVCGIKLQTTPALRETDFSDLKTVIKECGDCSAKDAEDICVGCDISPIREKLKAALKKIAHKGREE